MPTPGRYVFTPEGVPFYEYAHALWSGWWVTDEEGPRAYGQRRGFTYKWYNGSSTFPYPDLCNVAEGSLIAIGGTSPTPPGPPQPFFGGFPLSCYSFNPFLAPPVSFLPDIQSRTDQLALAEVMRLQYVDSAAAQAALVAWHGTPANGNSWPNSDAIVPGVNAVWGRGTFVLVISGTTNELQLSAQVLDVLNPLAETAYYATLRPWETSAHQIFARVSAFAGSLADKWLIAGHSYGAALACILGARLRVHRPEVKVQIFTMGCPKPGDRRLHDLLLQQKILGLVNENDCVPYVPPAPEDLPAIFGLVAGLAPDVIPDVLLRLEYIRRHPNEVRLREDGVLDNLVIQPAGQAIFQRLVEEVLAGNPPTAVAAHFASEYVRRLSL